MRKILTALVLAMGLHGCGEASPAGQWSLTEDGEEPLFVMARDGGCWNTEAGEVYGFSHGCHWRVTDAGIVEIYIPPSDEFRMHLENDRMTDEAGTVLYKIGGPPNPVPHPGVIDAGEAPPEPNVFPTLPSRSDLE